MVKTAINEERDRLAFFDRIYPSWGDVFRLPGRQVFVADGAIARAILSNPDGLYVEHSDFFSLLRGTFGPRSAQVKIGQASRAFLTASLAARAPFLAESVRRRLAPTSEWPDAGNWLVYEHVAPALVAPDSPPALRRTVAQIVERSVLAGARERGSFIGRAAFRYRTMLELTRAVEDRRRHRLSEPRDLLDVVVLGADGVDVPAAELAEVFLSFVFGAGGSVGFALGWSLYLLGLHPGVRAEPAFVVREALRLYPVAWQLARRPARPHELLGLKVTPEDEVVVCPYLVHRNPRHWTEPTRFQPERWASSDPQRAFIPFGWGPHMCVGGALSMKVVEDILGVLLAEYELTVRAGAGRPHQGPSLAPPRFTLRLSRTGASTGARRHELERAAPGEEVIGHEQVSARPQGCPFDPRYGAG